MKLGLKWKHINCLMSTFGNCQWHVRKNFCKKLGGSTVSWNTWTSSYCMEIHCTQLAVIDPWVLDAPRTQVWMRLAHTMMPHNLSCGNKILKEVHVWSHGNAPLTQWNVFHHGFTTDSKKFRTGPFEQTPQDLKTRRARAPKWSKNSSSFGARARGAF